MRTLATTTAVMLLSLARPASADIIFEQDWEDGGTGSESQGFAPEQSCCDHTITNVDTRAYDGTRSCRFLVLDGDPPIDGHTGRATSSVNPGAMLNGTYVLPYDEDRWFGFAVHVPSNPNMVKVNVFNTHTQNWGSGCDVASASSPISFRITGPDYQWGGGDYRWYLFTHPPGTNGAPPGKEGVFWVSADGDVDQWTTFVFHFNLSFQTRSEGGEGLLEIWKNGELIHQDYDFNLSEYPVPESCGHFYPKIGASTSGTAGYPLEAFHDAIRWGDENSSYAEVDPARGEGGSGNGGGSDGGGGTGSGAAGAAGGGADGVGGGATAGSGGAPPDMEPSSDDEGGCGCRVTRTNDGSLSAWAVLLAVGLAWRRRRT